MISELTGVACLFVDWSFWRQPVGSITNVSGCYVADAQVGSFTCDLQSYLLLGDILITLMQSSLFGC